MSVGHLLVAFIAVTVVAGECVDALVTTLIDLHLGALIHIAVGRLVGVIRAVRYFVTDQTIINTLAVGASKLSLGTGGVLLFAVHLIRMVTTVVFAIASVLIAYTLNVLARELQRGACLVLGVAELALIGSIAAIVVVIASPTLQKVNFT